MSETGLKLKVDGMHCDACVRRVTAGRLSGSSPSHAQPRSSASSQAALQKLPTVILTA